MKNEEISRLVQHSMRHEQEIYLLKKEIEFLNKKFNYLESWVGADMKKLC